MFIRPRKSDGIEPKERALWADLAALGMTFPLAIVLGFFLGRWIGGKLGHPEGGQWVGLAWGIAAAFWELIKTTKRLDRYDAQRAKEQAAGQEAEAKRPFPGDEDGDGV